jgi:hypothetical protein
MSHFGQKAAMALVAFATVGSTLFGGAALADVTTDGGDDVTATATGGAGGNGGNGGSADTAVCVNTAVQVSMFNWSDDESASGNQESNQSCNETVGAGGAGGSGGSGDAVAND